MHKPWGSAQIRFALTYPEVYEVGASNLGHIILYGILNKQEGLLCDRAYFPGARLGRALAGRGRILVALCFLLGGSAAAFEQVLSQASVGTAGSVSEQVPGAFPCFLSEPARSGWSGRHFRVPRAGVATKRRQ